MWALWFWLVKSWSSALVNLHVAVLSSSTISFNACAWVGLFRTVGLCGGSGTSTGTFGLCAISAKCRRPNGPQQVDMLVGFLFRLLRLWSTKLPPERQRAEATPAPNVVYTSNLLVYCTPLISDEILPPPDLHAMPGMLHESWNQRQADPTIP